MSDDSAYAQSETLVACLASHAWSNAVEEDHGTFAWSDLSSRVDGTSSLKGIRFDEIWDILLLKIVAPYGRHNAWHLHFKHRYEEAVRMFLRGLLPSCKAAIYRPPWKTIYDWFKKSISYHCATNRVSSAVLRMKKA